MTTAVFRRRPADYLVWFLLAGALVAAAGIRGRLATFPLERDEGEFAYAGQLILQGVPPYQLAYNMKLPGTYLAYAALMAVFGQTTAGIHLGLLAVNLATIVLLFFLVRALFDPFSAAVAALAYALLSVSPSVLGMAAHATHFVAFFAVAGAWALWSGLQSGKTVRFLVGGLLLGIGFLMKQQAVFLLAFGGVVALIHNLRVWNRRVGRAERAPPTGSCLIPGGARRPTLRVGARRPTLLLAAQFGSYTLGALLPYAITCLWLWRAGVFDKFWFWTVQYARAYVQEIPLKYAGIVFWQNVQGVVGSNWPIWLLAAIGLVAAAVPGKSCRGLRPFVFAFVVFSCLCVCPGFFFRQHYFIVMLPAVAMLAGVGSRGVWRIVSWRLVPDEEHRGAEHPSQASTRETASRKPGSSASPPRRKRRGAHQEKAAAIRPARGSTAVAAAMVAALLVAAIVLPVWQQQDFFFFWTPEAACRRVYFPNPFVECPVIADYLAKNTTPEQTVAVLGSEPEVYFDARRRSATGYIYTYGLVEEQPLARQMQEEMIREIEAAKPEFIVFVQVPTSWLANPKSETLIFQWANSYLARFYRPTGVVDILSQDQTEYRWDEQIKGNGPRSPYNLVVYRRTR